MDRCDPYKLLSSHMLKVTKPRLLLLGWIIEKQELFTANILFKDHNEHMDLVTIYRILTVFSDYGLIREVLSNDKSRTYELACKHNPIHPHFNCKKCGKLFCLNSLPEKDLHSIQKLYSNFEIENISMNISGICEDCKP